MKRTRKKEKENKKRNHKNKQCTKKKEIDHSHQVTTPAGRNHRNVHIEKAVICFVRCGTACRLTSKARSTMHTASFFDSLSLSHTPKSLDSILPCPVAFIQSKKAIDKLKLFSQHQQRDRERDRISRSNCTEGKQKNIPVENKALFHYVPQLFSHLYLC